MGNFFEKNSCLEKKDNAADAEENRENARSCRKKVLYAAGLAGGLYAVLRYLLPLVAPFVFAFFIVRILYPQLCRAEKRLRIRKDILMAGFLLLLTGILAAGFFFLLSKGTAWAVKIGSESGAIKDQVNMAFENGCCRAEELLGREQGEIRAFFQDKGDEMAKTVGREILPKAADWTAKSCSFALRTGAFWGIGMIAAFWLCKDYARFSEWMKKSEIWENIDRILRMTGGYCRAQLKILVIISGITVVGLWIGKVRNGLWIGLLAGILDALPMIGTGIVLIPTAIWQLLNENPQGAAFASVTYVACIAARELLEPRLLGAQIGLPPVLQLRETPLCTGADRAVIQNNLAGAAIQRADMCSVYQAGFVTEKKALVEFGERFIQGAAALVDRSRRMDGDAVRTGRFDIKNFMDWYE